MKNILCLLLLAVAVVANGQTTNAPGIRPPTGFTPTTNAPGTNVSGGSPITYPSPVTIDATTRQVRESGFWSSNAVNYINELKTRHAITNIGGIAATNGFATNLMTVFQIFNMTNTPAGDVGGLSTTNGSPYFVGPANCFANYHPGVNFVITNDQYLILDVVANNKAIVFPRAQHSYTNAPYTIYPNNFEVQDINQRFAGWCGGDGTFGAYGNYGVYANSGVFVWANGTNSIIARVNFQGAPGLGSMFEFDKSDAAGGAPFSFSTIAPYSSVMILQNGFLSLKYGITNYDNTPIPIKIPVQLYGVMPVSRTVTSGTTLTTQDNTVYLNGTTLTATLPTAVGITDQEFIIFLKANSTGTVATTSAQTINGSSTYSLSAQYKYVKVKSDGANWFIVASN